MAEQETIADIVAEIHKEYSSRGGAGYCGEVWIDLLRYADRFEAAHKRELGYSAKWREALELCVKGMCGFCRMDAEARGMTTWCVHGCEALLKAKAALAETEGGVK